MQTDGTKLEQRLQGLEASPVSDLELEQFIKRYQYVMDPKAVEYWTQRRAKTFTDGPVDLTAFKERRYEIYAGKATLQDLQADRVNRRMSEGQLDDLSKIALAQQDHARLPNYEAGRRQVTERLGLSMLDGLATMVPMFRPEDQAKLRTIMGDALAEYESRVSGAADPVKLGEEIGRKYMDTQMAPILGGMAGGLEVALKKRLGIP